MTLQGPLTTCRWVGACCCHDALLFSTAAQNVIYVSDLDEAVEVPSGTRAGWDGPDRPHGSHAEDGATRHRGVSGAIPPKDGEASSNMLHHRANQNWWWLTSHRPFVLPSWSRWRSSGTTLSAPRSSSSGSWGKARPSLSDISMTLMRMASSTGSEPTQSKSSGCRQC